tara:strand:- start:2800 stop:3855 length:1056 start_codon:yes stop_codon:yes gene_type:complete
MIQNLKLRFSKKILPTLITTSLFTLSYTPYAAADSIHKGPDISGSINLGLLSVDSRDIDAHAFDSKLGIGGLYIADNDIKVRYDLVGQFSAEINNADDTDSTWTLGSYSPGKNEGRDGVYVETASIVVITNLGAFVIAPRTASKHWQDLYGQVDQFEYNRMHSQTGDIAIFGQVQQSEDVVAYAAPRLLDGRLQLIAAALTANDKNGVGGDILSARAIYDDKKLHFGVGYVHVAQEQLPAFASNDATRTTVGAGYRFDSINVGATYEINTDMPTSNGPNATDWDAYAVVAEFMINDQWSSTFGYASTERNDNSGVLAKLQYKLDKESYIYLESGQYKKANDNVSAGVKIAF